MGSDVNRRIRKNLEVGIAELREERWRLESELVLAGFQDEKHARFIKGLLRDLGGELGNLELEYERSAIISCAQR